MEIVNENLVLTQATRPVVEYSTFPKQDEFSLQDKQRKYLRQFFAMYQHRLALLKPRVDEEAFAKWGDDTRRVDGQKIQHKDKILDITSGQLCWVLGTVFCDMNHKLNILQDVEHGTDDVMPSAPKKYVQQDAPIVMLEDESGRAILHNTALLKHTGLVTGCFVAVLGIEIQAGIFEIMEVIYPTPAPQRPLPTSSSLKKYLALVSGLKFSKDTEIDLRLIMLQQWLNGELGGSEDNSDSSQICRLVIAGNSVAEIERKEKDNLTFGSKNTSHFSAELLVLFNKWLSEVLASVPVSVMPGDTDPAEICMPQQQMHRSIFGQNSGYVGSAVQTLTNPAWLELEGLRILGTAGQNIDDIAKYSAEGVDTLDTMAKTMTWQNIVPTAPDTLYCYPFDDSDPFTLTETPHVYFAGNQAEAGSRKVQVGSYNVQCVSVPSFHETGEIVLVDLATAEVKVVKMEV